MGDIKVTDSAHPSHLVEELVALRSAGELFDYTIKGTKESFHFHSLVLALVSPVFRAMLRSEMGESAKKEATFPSIPDNIMAKIIDYAYNGTCLFSRDCLMDLVKAARYLQMSKLLKMCQEQISTLLQPTNCIPWLQLADKLNLTTIMPKIQKMMRTTFNEIITTSEYEQLEKPEVLQYLTDVLEHGPCSDDLLNGVLQWVKYDGHHRLDHMKDFLGVVQIEKCSNAFLSKMLADNAELFDTNKDMYKLIVSELVKNPKNNVLGDVETIIIVGGQFRTNKVNTACWMLLNDEMVEFSEFESDITLKFCHSVCQIPGGLMLTGGLRSDLCVIFVLTMKMWVKQESLPATRHDHASCFNKGKVFVIGGLEWEGFWCSTDSVDFMDLEKKSWHNGPSLPLEAGEPHVVSFKSALFVLDSDKSKFYQLDGDEKSWLTKSALPSPSNGCSLAASDDNIFAAGGNKNINYMYTLATDVWCRLTGPSLQERLGTLVHYQQKLYLLPGCKRDKNLVDIEEYDISADKWSLTKWKLPKPMWRYTAFLVDVPKLFN